MADLGLVDTRGFNEPSTVLTPKDMLSVYDGIPLMLPGQGTLTGYGITGTTKVNGVAQKCTVLAYDMADFSLRSGTVSDSTTGEYTIFGLNPHSKYFVVCILINQSDFCPAVQGPLTPTAI